VGKGAGISPHPFGVSAPGLSNFCPLSAGLLLIMQSIINKPFGQKICNLLYYSWAKVLQAYVCRLRAKVLHELSLSILSAPYTVGVRETVQPSRVYSAGP
jgi:hypothetical protein